MFIDRLPSTRASESTLQEPAQRVADLAAALEPYHQRYERVHDERAVFAYTYFNLTSDLAEFLATPDNNFDDPTWVADLAVAFGNRYMSAMDAIDDWQRSHHDDEASITTLHQMVPRPWADVYWAICHNRSTVLEDLVFAMGAHISYDLPYALLSVGTGIEHLNDYHRMNDVLGSETDAIQDAVTSRYNPLLSQLDHLTKIDEIFTDYWIRVGRSMAWYNAMRLQSPRSKSEAKKSVERTTFYFIQSVRKSGPWPLLRLEGIVRMLFDLTKRWPEPPLDLTT